MSLPASPVPASAFAISAARPRAPRPRRRDRPWSAPRCRARCRADRRSRDARASAASRRRRRRPPAARSRCRSRRPACCARTSRAPARRRSRGSSPSGARQIGEAEIDRDAARLLLLQAVGIDAGQRAHERGLAVVDMAGGADDHARLREPGASEVAAQEAVAVLEAAQVEHQRLAFDPPDHRDGKPAQRGRERVRARGLAGAILRPDREPRARHRLDRQRAGADLAGAIDRLDGEVSPSTSRRSGAASRCASAAISAFGRASRRSVGRRSARRSGSR